MTVAFFIAVVVACGLLMRAIYIQQTLYDQRRSEPWGWSGISVAATAFVMLIVYAVVG